MPWKKIIAVTAIIVAVVLLAVVLVGLPIRRQSPETDHHPTGAVDHRARDHDRR